MGSPEPPDANEANDRTLTTNDLYINNGPHTSEDSDIDEDRPNEGYELLPISNDENDLETITTSVSEDIADNDMNSNTSQLLHCDPNLPNVISIEADIDVWNEPRPKELEIDLDNSKTEEIMSVMSNITLPTINIPVWAKSVPEEKWKTELLQKIRQRNSTSSSK